MWNFPVCQETDGIKDGIVMDMIRLFDSHCHVDEEKFDEDREAVLQNMAEHGITRYGEGGV